MFLDSRLKDQDGKLFGSKYCIWAGKTWLFYFYPKDETAGCTAQACSFRDDYEEFLGNMNAEVIGISSDSPESIVTSHKKHRLAVYSAERSGFQIRQEKVWGSGQLAGPNPGRTTYIVDKEGKIRSYFHFPAGGLNKHVEVALNVIRELTE